MGGFPYESEGAFVVELARAQELQEESVIVQGQV